MDFRLGSEIKTYLETHHLYDDTDIISLAGAAKSLAQEDGGYLEGQLDLSKNLHQIKTVILMNHTDCGGYGGRSAFEHMDQEREVHRKDLLAAKERLVAKYPDLQVKLLLAEITENGDVSIQDV